MHVPNQIEVQQCSLADPYVHGVLNVNCTVPVVHTLSAVSNNLSEGPFTCKVPALPTMPSSCTIRSANARQCHHSLLQIAVRPGRAASICAPLQLDRVGLAAALIMCTAMLHRCRAVPCRYGCSCSVMRQTTSSDLHLDCWTILLSLVPGVSCA
jgi:hypothetical protein